MLGSPVEGSPFVGCLSEAECVCKSDIDVSPRALTMLPFLSHKKIVLETFSLLTACVSCKSLVCPFMMNLHGWTRQCGELLCLLKTRNCQHGLFKKS